MADEHAGGVVALVSGLIARAVAARASDLHLEPTESGLAVRLRVDALLHDLEPLPAVIGPNVIARLKVLAGLLTYRSDIPQEGSIAAGADTPVDIRVATFPTIRGERAVLRFLGAARRMLRLEELGHAPATLAGLEALLAAPAGLVIVCGPAGSGKTTTLYALLERILRIRPGASVLAVEDPVEIRLAGVTQVQINPARGLTYAAALRSLLRQDPQVLMIGEIRDAETAGVVIEAALTGHQLFSTLHSGTAAEALVRLREMGVPAYQLTSTVQGVLAQRLLRTSCAHCATGPTRCSTCLGTGYAGRAAIGHLVTMSAELRDALLGGADVAGLSATPLRTGSLRADAERLLAEGRTTAAEVQRVLG